MFFEEGQNAGFQTNKLFATNMKPADMIPSFEKKCQQEEMIFSYIFPKTK